MDAKIRITTESAQAVKGLRDVEAAGKAAVSAVSGSASAKPFDAITAGAQQAAGATKDAVKEAQALSDAQKAAAADATARAALSKKQAADSKAAADDALKAQRAAANQARQLGPQLTDIFVGLSTGQSPFTVLLQQGGQLKDVFGGVGNASKALFSIFTLGRVVVGGFVGALAGVALAAAQGAAESVALNKIVALTGDIAEASGGRLGTMAKQIADSQKASVGDVRETLTGLASSGEFTSTTLASAGKAAVALSKLTGQSAADTIKQFDGMSSGVAAWAQKSNQAYNFLSADQFKYIQSLEGQGRTQEAMKVTLDALSSTMEQRSAPAVGTLERAWNGLKSTLSGVLDSLKEIGRDDTPEKALDRLAKQLDLVKAAQSRSAKPDSFAPAIAAIQAQVDAQTEADGRARIRNADRVIDERNTQDAIYKLSKGYQDALASVNEAGAQKILGQELAALDRKQSAVDLANAKGLLSERQYNVELNTIEGQRLQAQAATVQRQIEIAASRAVTRPEDALANQAQVEALQGQLAQIQGQIAAAASKGRAIVEADALDTARQRATDWAQIWQRADDQVRQFAIANGATQAAAIADPIARASAEAAGKVTELQRQVKELQRDLELRLSLTIDPSQRSALQAQIQTLGEQAKTSIDEATRSATFASLQQQFTDLNQALALQEQRMQILVDASAISVIEAEKRKFAARAAALPQLEAIAEAMGRLGVTVGEKNSIEQTAQEVLKLKDAVTDFQKSTKAAGVDALNNGLTELFTRSKSVKDSLLDIPLSFGKAMLDLINKRLADQLFDQFLTAAQKVASSDSGGFLSSIFKYLTGAGSKSGSTTSGGGFTGDFAADYHHTGGVLGVSGGWTARAPAAAFGAFTPRYHTGGILGLKPNEVPMIGEVGEEVLTADDPRHVKNGGGKVVGDVNISVQVSGARGNEADQRGAANQLTDTITAVVNDWAAKQQRQGGILASRS